MMEKRIKIKLFIAVFVLVFSYLSLPVSSSEISYSSINGSTFYVGGSGPGNYTKIQDAVDDASDGDIIFVYSGYYRERVRINKSLEFIGENKDDTIIDSYGKGHVVYVDNANNFKIHGFKVMSSVSGGFDNGISIFRGNNAHIYDNIVAGGQRWAIRISGNNNIIENNRVVGDWIGGISIRKDSNNIVRNNIVSVYGYGLSVEGTGNEFYNNIVSGSEYGIYIELCERNSFRKNDISNCDIGIFSLNSKLNNINKNNFYDNLVNGKFEDYLLISFLPNFYRRNYWDDWSGSGPYFFKGILEFPKILPPYDEVNIISWRNYDWFPASQRYDI
jgi:parallel beta-helix repeat protein